jgi:hypothetical protein
MKFISDAHGGKSMSFTSVCEIAILEPHKNHGVVVLMELDYSSGIKNSYKGHHYVLQNVLILKVVQVTFYMTEHFSPSMGDPASLVNRHKTTTCGGRHILQGVMLSPRSVN